MTRTLVPVRPDDLALASFPPRSVIHVTGRYELLDGAVHQPIQRIATPGQTLAEMLAPLVQDRASATVYIIAPSGMVYGPILPDWWDRLRPRAGRTVMVQIIPGGGNVGPQSDRDKGRYWGQVAIIAATSFIPGGQGWAQIAAFAALRIAITVGGNLLLNALLPPAMPNKPDTLSGRKQADKESPTLSITGSQNRASAWGPIPVIYGQHRVYRGPA